MHRPLLYAALLCLGGVSLAVGMILEPHGAQFGDVATRLDVPKAAVIQCLGHPDNLTPQHAPPDAARLARCLSEMGHPVTTEAAKAAVFSDTPRS